jgi:hypothetical protein
MLIAAAVIPGPPAFVAELMGSAAPELDELRHAADLAIFRTFSDLVAASSDSPWPGPASAQLVIVGPGQPGEFSAAGPVSFGTFGRDFEVPALAERAKTDAELPTPLMVARYLASRDVAAHPEHADLWARARWITTSGADSAALGQRLREDDTRMAMIVVADGALCHGPKAPRAEDSRAEAYDDQVCEVLASGQLDRLARIDVNLGHELGASGPQVWPALFTAAAGGGAGELLWRGAPYGVGWAVATWRSAPEATQP